MQTSSQRTEVVRIGTLAELTGCTVPTIRYYEAIDLIPHAQRRSSGHRVYDDSAVHLLGFIRRCRDFGFTIEQIRSLSSLSRNKKGDCVKARDIVQKHLNGARAKILELMALERTLARFIDGCNESCVGGLAPDCTILKDLAQYDMTSRKQSGCCG